MKKTVNINDYLNNMQSKSSLNHHTYTTQIPKSHQLPHQKTYNHINHHQTAYQPQQINAATNAAFTKGPSLGEWSGINNVGYSPYYNRAGEQKQSSRSLKENEKQVEECVVKLKQIKGQIQKEISGLQHLLDQTSAHLQNSQQQFLKVKARILQCTSRYLDAAFKNYRKNMTKWSKFEDAERKGIELILQMKEFTQRQSRVFEQGKNEKDNDKLQNCRCDISNRIVHYNRMWVQLQRIRMECLKRRPTLKSDKIECFERSLEQLCIF